MAQQKRKFRHEAHRVYHLGWGIVAFVLGLTCYLLAQDILVQPILDWIGNNLWVKVSLLLTCSVALVYIFKQKLPFVSG